MNIFILHENPQESVKGYVDSHVVKITLEATQIANTALRQIGRDSLAFYGPTHLNHPWCKFAADNLSNWKFVYDYIKAIGNEYTNRYDKTHKSHRQSIEAWTDFASTIDNKVDQSTIPQTMPDEYRQPNVVSAYRDYYINDKIPQDWAKYDHTEKPSWLQPEH